MTGHERLAFTFPIKLEDTKKRGRPIRIKPSFQQHLGKDFEFNLYIGFIEHVVEKLLPLDFVNEYHNAQTPSALGKTFRKLDEQLPILHWTYPERTPGLLYVTTLCAAEYTHGVGRFMNDSLSRWVLPGKILAITCSPSLNFQFVDYDRRAYFMTQVILQVQDEKELAAIENNLPVLMREARLTILSVKHARNIMALKNLSTEQKAAIIQENLQSLIDRPSKEFDQTIFDQMHQFLLKVSAEERVNQIKEKMVPLLEQRPNVFESDIFHEIQHFVFAFRHKFSALRDLRHISRLIAFHYLFRKELKRQAFQGLKDRPIILKLMRTKLLLPTGNKPVLAILAGMNILHENEVFDQRHALEAIQHCLPNVRYVKESFVIDLRNQDSFRLFYIEVENESGLSFTIDEMKELRRKLPRELKASIENVTPTIFMPRNEEEVMRNIVLLSQELKYTRDIPQVVISFDTQNENELLFIVILLRILQPGDPSLQEIFSRSGTHLRFQDFDVKNVGQLRKKYIKEANVFTVRADKKPYLRKDFSLDLFKARQAVSSELSRILGDIRDFNGGILSKQQELFDELRRSLGEDKVNEFLLENFFYSLTPPLMQSILPATILKNLFLMVLEATERSFKRDKFFLKSQSDPEYHLLIIASQNPAFKDIVLAAVARLQIPSSNLCFSFLKVYDIAALSYIFRCEDPHQCALFHNTIQQAMQKWESEQ